MKTQEIWKAQEILSQCKEFNPCGIYSLPQDILAETQEICRKRKKQESKKSDGYKRDKRLAP